MRTLLFRYHLAIWRVAEAIQLKLFQMACADMILVNKVDLVDRERIGKIKALARRALSPLPAHRSHSL